MIDLTKQSIDLDKYSVMNTSYAKRVFSENKISELLAYLVEETGIVVKIDRKDDCQWTHFTNILNHIKVPMQSTSSMRIKLDICSCDYLIAIHGIYSERLLDSKWNYSDNNITQKKKRE